MKETRSDFDQDAALRLLLEGTVAETGTEFFRALVRNLCRALGTLGAWVTEYLPAEKRLRAYAMWMGEDFVDHYEYPIDGTACAKVIEKRTLVHIPERLIELFPQDTDLIPLSAVSYLGMPLLDTDGTVLGHLGVLDDKPMPRDKRAIALFEVFVARATAEMRRLKTAQKLAAMNDSLNLALSDLSLSHEALQEAQTQLRAEKAQLEADLDLARKFQVALLPEHDPEFTWGGRGKSRSLQFFHFYEPSGAVGGDFFHILHFSENKTGIFFCDVMGHGVRAALISAILRGLIEELKAAAPDPGAFLTAINHSLAEILLSSGETMFATAFYLVADVEKLQLSYANAGHPRPLHLKRSDAILEPLPFPERSSGPALGLVPAMSYPTLEVPFGLGDSVFIHTDGIYEMAGSDGQEFGEERLARTIRSVMTAPVPDILGRVVETARSFSANGGFEDDVCLVAMHLTGQS